MKKILQKIKQFFTRVAAQTPGINTVLYHVADKLDTRQEKEELKKRILSQPRTVQVSEKSIMAEGVRALKQNMKANMHLFGPGKYYADGVDLLSYTPGQNQQRADVMTQTSDLASKDVKSQKEFDTMIDTRISHYKQLQNDVVKRNLIRAIRKETDPAKREELENEFQRKFKGVR